MPKTLAKSKCSQASRKVVRHRIRKAIERMILSGKFSPGEKLVQFQLAKKFGVSQGLIREALFELKEFGLVETSDNRGIFVRSLDARSIYEMLVIREIFDGVAARECCGRMSANDAARLRQLADAIYEAAVSGRQKEKILLDRDFHLEIVRLTDNRTLMMWSQQCHVLGKVIGSTQTVAPEATRRGHYAIIDAILSGDRVQAEKTAREHVLSAWPTFDLALIDNPKEVLWLSKNNCRKDCVRETG